MKQRPNHTGSMTIDNIQGELFNVLNHAYVSIARVDLARRDGVILQSREKPETIARVYGWDTLLRHCCAAYLGESDSKMVLHSFSSAHLLHTFESGQHTLSRDVRLTTGKLRWISISAFLVQEEGHPPYAYVMVRDADEQHLLRNVVDRYVYSNCDYFIYLDAKNNSYTMFSGSSDGTPLPPDQCNDYATELVKYAEAFVVPEDRQMVIREMRIERVLEQLGTHGMHAFYCGILDPVRGYTRKRLEYRYYDQPSGMILLSRSDVTAIYREQQEHQSALKAALLRAQSDPLTGLLNYQGTLEHSADPLARHDDGAAFFFIDLDNFKVVNDTLGHSAGDELLRRVADILRRETCPGAVVGRVGGDEFVALLPGLTSVEAVTEQAQRLCDAIARLTDRDFSGLPISCSIGIALAPEEGTDYASLAYKADMRAYKAKFGGKNGYAF